jgi:hypothetical protein
MTRDRWPRRVSLPPEILGGTLEIDVRTLEEPDGI